MGEADASVRNKLFAFLGLTVIQTFVVVIVRFAQQNGKYNFNPAASLAIAEFVKFCISAFMHYKSLPEGFSSFQSAFVAPFRDGTRTLYRTMIALAFLYAVNNQLTFVILRLTDPGTLTLGKSTTPMLTALLNFVMFAEPLNKLQWASVLLQICGLVVVLYDPCGVDSRASSFAVLIIVVACTITAITSVVNARVLKKEKTPINVCNMILYAFGVLFNLTFFLFNLTPTDQTSFFGGFTSLAPVLVVVCNSFVGVAITFVYKYGDAIVKTFAASASSAVLLYLSFLFFNVSMNASQIAGSVTVFVTCYIYFSIAPLLNAEKDEVLVSLNGEEENGEGSQAKIQAAAEMQRMRVIVGAVMAVVFIVFLSYASVTGFSASDSSPTIEGS